MTGARSGSCPTWISNPIRAGTTIRGPVTRCSSPPTPRWAPWYVVHSDNKRRARLNVLTHILSKIPYEEIRRPKAELPKRQDRGDQKETDYPFRVIREVF